MAALDRSIAESRAPNQIVAETQAPARDSASGG
jgi:hypothetical protein